MAHTYLDLAAINNEILPGSTAFDSEAASIVTRKLGIAEGVSRRIDYVCHRSGFGSGFGPRIGTNYYDGDNTHDLLLNDDLLSLSAFTVAPGTTQAAVSPVVTTDYYLANPGGGYTSPYRKIILHGFGSPTYFARGIRTITCTGTWGYSNTTVTSSTTMASGFSASTTATTFTTSATPLLSPGMTLVVGSEQMYLSGLSGTTATVVRGVNGTSAANHADGSAIAYYTYDSRVRDVALRLFMRRWKARDGGADGLDGSLDNPGIAAREGEDTIIRRGLSELLLLGTY